MSVPLSFATSLSLVGGCASRTIVAPRIMAIRSTCTRRCASSAARLSVHSISRRGFALTNAGVGGPGGRIGRGRAAFGVASLARFVPSRWRRVGPAPPRVGLSAEIAGMAGVATSFTATAKGPATGRHTIADAAAPSAGTPSLSACQITRPATRRRTVRHTRLRGVAALRPSMASGLRAAALTSLTFRLGAPSMSVTGGPANCATDLLILTLPTMRIGRLLTILFRSLGAGRMIRRI